MNILRTKRASKVEQKAFFIIFEGLLVAKVCLIPKSASLWSFAKRLVSIWGNFLEDILKANFFLSIALVAFLRYFLLADQLDQIPYMPLFVKLKDFSYEFWRIFSTRWNSSAVTHSKILPFNCSILFLSLSHITLLICTCSCSNSIPAHCKIILIRLVWILLFSWVLSVESYSNNNVEKFVND